MAKLNIQKKEPFKKLKGKNLKENADFLTRAVQKSAAYLKRDATEDTDIDTVRQKRRLDTTFKTSDKAWNRLKDAYPKYKSAHFDQDWLLWNSYVLNSYDATDRRYNLTHAATVFILERLRERGKLFDLINEIPDPAGPLEDYFTGVNEVSYPDTIVDKIKYALIHRNDDCGVYTNPKLKRRAILDEATARQKQHQDVPSRQIYERIINAIPENVKFKAIRNFKSATWKMAEAYLKGESDIYKAADRLYLINADKVDQYNRLANTLKNPLAITDLDSNLKRLSKLEDQVEETHNALAGLYDDELTMMKWSHDIFAMPDDVKKTYVDEKFVEALKEYKSPNPYEMAFALLLLADNDDDLIWCPFFPLMMLKYSAAHLPWAYPDKLDYQVKSILEQKVADKTDKRSTQYNEEVLIGNPDDEYDQMVVTPLQLYYALTRKAPPQAMVDGDITDLVRELNIPEKYHLHLTSALITANETWHSYLMEDDAGPKPEPEQKTDQPEEPVKDDARIETESLRKEIRALKEELKNLKNYASTCKRDMEKAQNETAETIANSKLEHDELIRLREMLYQHEAQEQPADKNPAYEFPFHSDKSIVVCGGHPTFYKQLSKLITGNIRYINNPKVSEELIRNADYVWLQTNAISHSEYYKVSSLCRTNDIPVNYLNFASARKCAEQIVDLIMEQQTNA